MSYLDTLLQGVEVEWKTLGGGNYSKKLLHRIRDIYSSEKVMYRQVLSLEQHSVVCPTSTTLSGHIVEWKTLGGGNYGKKLLHRIRDIYSSEKVMCCQVLDLEQHSVRNVTLGKKQITIKLHSVRNAS